MKRYALLFLFVLSIPGSAHASKTTATVRENAALAPGQSMTVEIETETAEPFDVGFYVGWITKQKPSCEINCVTARQTNINISLEIGAQHGLTTKYEPVDGRVVIEYTNRADHGVIIDIHAETRICDSQACTVLREKGITYPDVYTFSSGRIFLADVEAMETSKDGSYSRIKGKTVYGSDFDVIAIWWLIDEESGWPAGRGCAESIAQNGLYEPGNEKAYVLRGSYLENPVTNILTNTRCAWMKIGNKKDGDL